MLGRRSFVAALAVTLAACSGSTDAPDGGVDAGSVQIDPTLSSIQAHIFKTGCAVSQCHGGDAPQANLILTDTATSFAHLVNVPAVEVAPKILPDGGMLESAPGSGLYSENLCDALSDGGAPPVLVVPGDPDYSYLIWKLAGVDASGAPIEETRDCAQMPKVAGGQLPADQLAAIRNWIAAGALNN